MKFLLIILITLSIATISPSLWQPISARHVLLWLHCPAHLWSAFDSVADEHLPVMLNLTREESRFDPLAVGKQGELGLTQVHPYWHPEILDGDWRNPAYNVSVGYSIYLDYLNATETIFEALCRFNGDWSGEYAEKVMRRI